MIKSLLLPCVGIGLSTFVLADDAIAQDVEMTVEQGKTGWRSVREGRPVDVATSEAVDPLHSSPHYPPRLGQQRTHP